MTLERIEHRVDGLFPPPGHFSDAVSFGGMLFISGVVPIDKDGHLVGKGNISQQAEQVFANIGTVLSSVGAGFGSLLKITIFLTSVADRQAVDQVRRRMFGESRPGSTLIGVNELALPDIHIEVEAIAAMPTR
jgi:enamine deaminase RidA (YjgF/YER057c/UK114 family)